jgi:hypothetical protein
MMRATRSSTANEANAAQPYASAGTSSVYLPRVKKKPKSASHTEARVATYRCLELRTVCVVLESADQQRHSS